MVEERRQRASRNHSSFVVEELDVPAPHPDRVGPVATASPAGPHARRTRSSPPSARPGPPRRGRSPPRAPRTRRCRRPRAGRPGAWSPPPSRRRRTTRHRPRRVRRPANVARPSRVSHHRRARTPCRCGRNRPARHRRPGGRLGHCRPARNVLTMSAPWRDRIDSGWNCTPSCGSSRCRTAITTSSTRAVTSRDGRHGSGGQRVVAHRVERRRDAGEHTGAFVRHRRDLAVGGLDPRHRSAVRRDEGLHAETDTEHRDAEDEHRRAQGEVGLDLGMSRAGREHDVAGGPGALEHRQGCRARRPRGERR